MYEKFYGFREKPFSLFPDPRFLFLNRRYQLGLNLLEYGVLNKNGMILLTGDPGTGKTTLLQTIIGMVDDRVAVGNVTFTPNNEPSLLPWVLQAFDIPGDRSLPSSELFHLVADFLGVLVQQDREGLLVVDEAQNLDSVRLEELRLLFNMNDRFKAVFQIVIAGHPSLRERLQHPQLQAFVQRIGTDFSLEPLDLSDTRAYIHHRLRTAGGSAEVFSEHACDLIYRYAQGNPRLINQLCEMSLVYGYSEHSPVISERLVTEAAQDRQQGGLLFTGKLPQPEPRQGGSMPDSAPPVESMVSSLASSSQREAGAVMPHQSDVSRHWEDALKNQAQGWYLEAIRGLKLVAAHADYHRKAWYRIGQCYMAMGRSADALAAFHTSLGMSAHQTRESAPIYQSIGDVLERLGRFDEASRYYDLAQFVDPKIVCGVKGRRQASPSAFFDDSQSSWWPQFMRRWWAKFQHSA